MPAYAQRIVGLYGAGERSWLGRQTDRLPDAVARAVVRWALRFDVTRRHVVFGSIFGMRETDGAQRRPA